MKDLTMRLAGWCAFLVWDICMWIYMFFWVIFLWIVFFFCTFVVILNRCLNRLYSICTTCGWDLYKQWSSSFFFGTRLDPLASQVWPQLPSCCLCRHGLESSSAYLGKKQERFSNIFLFASSACWDYRGEKEKLDLGFFCFSLTQGCIKIWKLLILVWSLQGVHSLWQ